MPHGSSGLSMYPPPPPLESELSVSEELLLFGSLV